jgi:hypothetical protein
MNRKISECRSHRITQSIPVDSPLPCIRPCVSLGYFAGPDNEGARHQKDTDHLRGALRPSRYVASLGDAAVDQRISFEEPARQLRLHRQVPALRLQLNELKLVSHDRETPRRLIGGGRRGQPSKRQRYPPAKSLWQLILPQ